MKLAEAHAAENHSQLRNSDSSFSLHSDKNTLNQNKNCKKKKFEVKETLPVKDVKRLVQSMPLSLHICKRRSITAFLKNPISVHHFSALIISEKLTRRRALAMEEEASHPLGLNSLMCNQCKVCQRRCISLLYIKNKTRKINHLPLQEGFLLQILLEEKSLHLEKQ